MFSLPSRETQSGHTLLESLVVISILSILLGMVCIGINAAREGARRAKCQNNLHQLGVAISSFANTEKKFPSIVLNRSVPGLDPLKSNPFIAILPELEVPFRVDGTGEVVIGENTPQPVPPPILRCPAGGEFLGYRYSLGTVVDLREQFDGVLRLKKGLNPAEITDGLSNTAMLSERPAAEGVAPRISLALIRATPVTFDRSCRSAGLNGRFASEIGIKWKYFQPKDIAFNHHFGPNPNHFDCESPRTAISRSWLAVSARSNHAGGVFCVRADGSVHWVASSIDIAAWRALGTVAGHEVVAYP